MAHPMITCVVCPTMSLPAPTRPLWRASVDRLEWSLVRVLDAYFDWRARALSRRQLLSLDDRLLKDIGIDRATAEAEAQRGRPLSPWS